MWRRHIGDDNDNLADGDDVLAGNGGNDQLQGDDLHTPAAYQGDDTLNGGEGDDTYVLDGDSDDLIADLAGVNTLLLQSGGGQAEISLTAVDHAGDVVLNLANGHTVTLANALFTGGYSVRFRAAARRFGTKLDNYNFRWIERMKRAA